MKPVKTAEEILDWAEHYLVLMDAAIAELPRDVFFKGQHLAVSNFIEFIQGELDERKEE